MRFFEKRISMFFTEEEILNISDNLVVLKGDQKSQTYLFGDITISDEYEWEITQFNDYEFLVSLTRPVNSYGKIELSNFSAQIILSSKAQKLDLIIRPKKLVIYFGIIWLILILFLFSWSVYDKSYLGYLTILFPGFVLFNLRKERNKFIKFVKKNIIELDNYGIVQ